jgi:hypothetical protein
MWQLRQDEVVLLAGCTPPARASRYFAATAYLFSTHLRPAVTAASDVATGSGSSSGGGGGMYAAGRAGARDDLDLDAGEGSEAAADAADAGPGVDAFSFGGLGGSSAGGRWLQVFGSLGDSASIARGQGESVAAARGRLATADDSWQLELFSNDRPWTTEEQYHVWGIGDAPLQASSNISSFGAFSSSSSAAQQAPQARSPPDVGLVEAAGGPPQQGSSGGSSSGRGSGSKLAGALRWARGLAGRAQQGASQAAEKALVSLGIRDVPVVAASPQTNSYSTAELSRQETALLRNSTASSNSSQGSGGASGSLAASSAPFGPRHPGFGGFTVVLMGAHAGVVARVSGRRAGASWAGRVPARPGQARPWASWLAGGAPSRPVVNDEAEPVGASMAQVRREVQGALRRAGVDPRAVNVLPVPAAFGELQGLGALDAYYMLLLRCIVPAGEGWGVGGLGKVIVAMCGGRRRALVQERAPALRVRRD